MHPRKLKSIAIEWFQCKEMIVNPDKFQAVIAKNNSKMDESYPLFINGETVNSAKNVTSSDLCW